MATCSAVSLVVAIRLPVSESEAAPAAITCRFQVVRDRIGVGVSDDEIVNIFDSLGIPVTHRNDASCTIEVPSFRLDLEREDADLGSPAAATLVHWGLLRLSRAEARLLERFYLDGQGMAALAAEMGLSVRAVEGRLRRSREALRRVLAPYLVAEGSEA